MQKCYIHELFSHEKEWLCHLQESGIIVKKWNQPQSVSNIAYILLFVIPRFWSRLNQANRAVKSVNSSHGLESRRVRSSNSREGGGRRERWAVWRERTSKYMHTCMGDVLIQPSIMYSQHRWIEIKIEKRKILYRRLAVGSLFDLRSLIFWRNFQFSLLCLSESIHGRRDVRK